MALRAACVFAHGSIIFTIHLFVERGRVDCPKDHHDLQPSGEDDVATVNNFQTKGGIMKSSRTKGEDFKERVLQAKREILAAFPENWKKQVSELLRRFNAEHANRNKEVSYKTRENRRDGIFLMGETLRKNGFKIRNIYNINNKHVECLVRIWEDTDKKPGTIQNNFSILKTFMSWMGTDIRLKPLTHYLKDKTAGERTFVAQNDKSWEAAGVDPDVIIEAIEAEDKLVAIQIKLIACFGLRKKEAVCFRPWICEIENGTAIQVYDGTKGGRYRVIPIIDDVQREALEEAKKIIRSQTSHIGNPEKKLHQNMRRIQYLMTKHGITKNGKGVTLHGLRHSYANRRFKKLSGTVSPVQGGSLQSFMSEEGKRYRLIISGELGHARIQITGSYIGGRVRKKKFD